MRLPHIILLPQVGLHIMTTKFVCVYAAGGNCVSHKILKWPLHSSPRHVFMILVLFHSSSYITRIMSPRYTMWLNCGMYVVCLDLRWFCCISPYYADILYITWCNMLLKRGLQRYPTYHEKQVTSHLMPQQSS